MSPGSGASRSWSFAALLDREQLINQRLRNVAEKLCGGSLTPLLMNLMRARPLSTREIDELQQLLKDATPSSKRKGGR